MNSFKITILIALTGVFWLSSCATKKDTEFLDFDSEEVGRNLEIDQEKFDKFTVKEKKIKKKEKVKVPSKSKAKQAQAKKGTKKKKPSQRKSDPAKAKTPPSSKVTSPQSGKISYPKEDYPDAFRKYDKTSVSVWADVKPIVKVGEKFTFKVGYLGLTVGHIQMETLPTAEINGEEVYHFKARMRSARYYSYIYTLDDSIETYISREGFSPVKYVLLQRESGQTVDDLQLFDREELKTYHFYKRLKKGKRKRREIEKPIPYYFQDSYSALHFVRGLPFNIGDRYKFPIVTRGKIWILDIHVEKIEEIEVNDKAVRAYRLNAETRFPGVLEKKGDILFWYSADDNKRLMKFEAEVKIGSVSGELVEYHGGK